MGRMVVRHSTVPLHRGPVGTQVFVINPFLSRLLHRARRPACHVPAPSHPPPGAAGSVPRVGLFLPRTGAGQRKRPWESIKPHRSGFTALAAAAKAGTI